MTSVLLSVGVLGLVTSVLLSVGVLGLVTSVLLFAGVVGFGDIGIAVCRCDGFW